MQSLTSEALSLWSEALAVQELQTDGLATAILLVISLFRRYMINQDHEFQVNLCAIMRHCLKSKTNEVKEASRRVVTLF